jgi:uncharacterized protein YciI
MTLIPDGQNLFVVDLHYTADFDKIDPLIPGHLEFLKTNYDAGIFITSGAKVPRTGGVIIATAPSIEHLQDLLKSDPFCEQSVARYTVTEFNATMKAAGFK